MSLTRAAAKWNRDGIIHDMQIEQPGKPAIRAIVTKDRRVSIYLDGELMMILPTVPTDWA